MKNNCPWCGYEVPGKPYQFSICQQCNREFYWGGTRVFKSKLEAANETKRQDERLHRGKRNSSSDLPIPTLEPADEVIENRFRVYLRQQSKFGIDDTRLSIPDRLLLFIIRIIYFRYDKDFIIDKFLEWRRQLLGTAKKTTRTFTFLLLLVFFLSIAIIVFFVGLGSSDSIKQNTVAVASKISLLTKEVARELIENQSDELDLSQCIFISNGAAEELAQWKGNSIKLVGLRTLDTQSAQELAKWKGSTLDLSGLKEITQTTAQALKNWSGRLLRLNGIQSINDDVAETLADFQSTSVELLGLVSVGRDTFAILQVNPKLSLPEIKFESIGVPAMSKALGGDFIEAVRNNTNNIRSLTIEQAKYLMEEVQGDVLYLSGLTSIDKDVARELARFKWNELHPTGEKVLRSAAERIEFARLCAKKRMYFSSLNSIDKDAAQELAKFEGSLTLNLTSLDKDVAEALVNGESYLSLPVLLSINKDVAEVLAKAGNRKSLRMRSLTQIDNETLRILQSRSFIQLPEDLPRTAEAQTKPTSEMAESSSKSLNETMESKQEDSPSSQLEIVKNAISKANSSIRFAFKSINRDVAQELAKFQGNSLDLNGLTSIDKDVAQELAKWQGRYLYLEGLTSIDKDVAQELAKFQGSSLHLDGLTSIDKDVAQELAKRQGHRLYLDGLTSIDKDVTRELAKLQVDLLSLKGLTSIDKDVAQELAKWQGNNLYLDGLTSIDKDVAHELAKFQGTFWILRGLTSIDKDVAQELAKFQGSYMYVDGLTSIDKDVAQELAKFQGRSLYLDGLTSIDKDVAQELAKFQGSYLLLNGLTSIDKEVAQELAKFQGYSLHLDGLTSIDKDVAQELAKRRGYYLHLDGLTSIDEEVAQELAKFQGTKLFLSGLTAFDQGVSAELQEFEGELLLSEAYELGDVFNEYQAFPNDLPRTFTNSIGISMKLIPAGKCRFSKYRAEVEIKPFYMSATEVTNIQGKRLMGFSPSGDKGDDWPITGASYQEAMKFCSFLSVKEQSQKRKYRLPTAEEWKYAFLAGTETEEKGFGITVDQAWCEENGWPTSRIREAHPVGQKKPNNWGLYDMLGNVDEYLYTTPSLIRRHKNSKEWKLIGAQYSGTGSSYFLAPTKTAISPTAKYGDTGIRIVMIPDE